MKASDALIFQAVDEVQRAVRAEAAKSQKKIDMILEESRQQREEARLQTKVLEDQVSKLTSMMEVLLKTRMDMALGGEGVDLSRDDGVAKPEVEKAVDEQLKAENVRDLMSRMPVPEDEDERLRVVRKMGFEAGDVSDLIGDPDFERLVDEACAEIRRRDWHDLLHRRDPRDSALHGELRRGGQHQTSRRLLASQGGHRVSTRHQETRRHLDQRHDGRHAGGSAPQHAGDDGPRHLGCRSRDGSMVPRHGRGRSGRRRSLPTTPSFRINPCLEGTKPATYGAFRIFAEKASDMEAVNHYSGAPISVEGQCVGTFCLMDGKHRDDVDTEKLRAYAARAAKLIEEKAAKRGLGRRRRVRSGNGGWFASSSIFLFCVIKSRSLRPTRSSRCAADVALARPKLYCLLMHNRCHVISLRSSKKSSTTIRGRESSAPRWKRVTLASLVLPW